MTRAAYLLPALGVRPSRRPQAIRLNPAGSSPEGAAPVSACQPAVIEADTQPPSRAALPRPWWRRALFLLTTTPEF